MLNNIKINRGHSQQFNIPTQWGNDWLPVGDPDIFYV